MPPDASSRPDIGLKRTETSTLSYGPPGATITLNSFSVARWTKARPPCEAPETSSMAHVQETVVQPSSGLVKSILRSGADQAQRCPIDPYVPPAAAASMS